MKIKFLISALILLTGFTLGQTQKFYIGTGQGPNYSNPGYSCSSCHASGGIASPKFDEWKTTNHSIATDSGYAQSSHFGYSCLRCHATGWDTSKDNFGADEYVVQDSTLTPDFRPTDQAKWDDVKNVGCEACHGAMGDSTGYLSDDHWDFKTKNTLDYSAETCGVCHQGSHHGYYEEWAISGHAKSLTILNGNIALFPTCVRCHVGQNAAAYINGAYFNGPDKGKPYEDKIIVDKNDPNIQPITCVVCHDPHSASNGKSQLRIASTQAEVVCDKCHNNRTVFGNVESPHRGVSECLTGTEGFGARFSSTQLISVGLDTLYQNSAHTFAALNRCIDCHVNPDGKDEFGNAAHGHSFKARTEACAKCHLDYYSVVDTSNHAKMFDYRRTQTITDSLITVLEDELAKATTADKKTDIYKKANENLLAAKGESSKGIHNTKLTQKLLVASIALFEPGVTDLKIENNNMPATYSLSQNYPNPFNPQTEIKFALPQPGNVRLVIYDSIGREVAVLVNQHLNAGTYRYSWNASGFSSGIYLYRIIAKDFTMVKKMIYMK